LGQGTLSWRVRWGDGSARWQMRLLLWPKRVYRHSDWTSFWNCGQRQSQLSLWRFISPAPQHQSQLSLCDPQEPFSVITSRPSRTNSRLAAQLQNIKPGFSKSRLRPAICALAWIFGQKDVSDLAMIRVVGLLHPNEYRPCRPSHDDPGCRP
jgi:hypothetical protein